MLLKKLIIKAALQKQSKLPKSTMYSALKHGNPTIKTLAKIMHVPKTTVRHTRRSSSHRAV